MAAGRVRRIEPPAGQLLQRVLQLFPARLRVAVDRALIVEAPALVQQGAYARGVVKLNASAAQLREADPECAGRYSRFVVTTVHEWGHAVFARVPNDHQRAVIADDYLDALLQTSLGTRPVDPTERDLEHHFVTLFVQAVLLDGRWQEELARFGIALGQ